MPTETAYAVSTREMALKHAFHSGPYCSLDECMKEVPWGSTGEVIVEIETITSSKIVREWDGNAWVVPKGVL